MEIYTEVRNGISEVQNCMIAALMPIAIGPGLIVGSCLLVYRTVRTRPEYAVGEPGELLGRHPADPIVEYPLVGDVARGVSPQERRAVASVVGHVPDLRPDARVSVVGDHDEAPLRRIDLLVSSQERIVQVDRLGGLELQPHRLGLRIGIAVATLRRVLPALELHEEHPVSVYDERVRAGGTPVFDVLRDDAIEVQRLDGAVQSVQTLELPP